jgi:hypothetical protein
MRSCDFRQVHGGKLHAECRCAAFRLDTHLPAAAIRAGGLVRLEIEYVSISPAW